MKASKFSEAQIAFVLKQAEDGTPIGEVCRKAGISDATFYNWRVHVLLKRDGWPVNAKRIYRLYKVMDRKRPVRAALRG